MSRNHPIVYSRCMVLAIACAACIVLSAQGFAQTGPAQSAPFLPVPSSPAIPSEPSPYLSAGISYPETNIGQNAAELMPAPAPLGRANSGTSSLIPQSADQNLIYPAPGSLGAGANRPPSASPFQAATLEPERPSYFEEAWSWQYFPDSLLYQSYLAGIQEPRFASEWVYQKDLGWLWNATLGGRAGLLRYGTVNSPWPEGVQLDIEGAAFVRMNLEADRDVDGADFRFGVPLTARRGPWQTKFGYYHLSSHLGDEYMVRNRTFNRLNYVRDCLLWGVGYFITPDIRIYSEADYGFNVEDGAKPWKFQFGVEYSPAEPTEPGHWAAPFVAINGVVSEETSYSGNITVQTGLQWRGRSGHLARIGMQYFNGMSDQEQFFRNFEEQLGMGVWYDF